MIRTPKPQALKKFGKVVTVRRWVRGAPRRADVSFSAAEEMDAAIAGMADKEGSMGHLRVGCSVEAFPGTAFGVIARGEIWKTDLIC